MSLIHTTRISSLLWILINGPFAFVAHGFLNFYRIEENVTTGKYWANLPEVIFLNVISYLEIQDRLKLERGEN